MKKQNRNFTIFSTLDLWKDAKASVIEDHGQNADVDLVYDYYNMLSRCARLDFERTLQKIEENMDGGWLCLGTVQLWDGTRRGGVVVRYLDDFLTKFLDGADDIEIYTKNGKLFVAKHHHDGTNTFECKLLTKRGYNAFDDWEYGKRFKGIESEAEMHKALYNSTRYSKNAHYENFMD